MGVSTVYDVKIKFLMDDQASSRVRAMDSAVQQAKRSTETLTGTFAKLGLAAGGIFGIREAFHAAKDLVVDYNSQMEQAKITTAGMFQLNLGGSFEANMNKAVDLVGRLQQRAKLSIGTTQDMVEMMSNLAQGLSAAGITANSEIENIVAGSVVAAKSMGIEANMAAYDVDAALRGMYHARDRFTSKLLGPMGYAGETGRSKFNALDAQKRAEIIKEAFKQPAIADLQKAQEHSFAGEVSTLKDNLQIAFGGAGLATFKRITGEIRQWNKWIADNGQKIQEMSRSLSDWLGTVFGVIKDAAKFLYDNRDTLMAIAKMWALAKFNPITGLLKGGGGLLGAGLSAAGAGIGGGPFAESLASAGGMITKWLGPAGMIAGALAGFIAEVEFQRRHWKEVQAPVVDAASKYTYVRSHFGQSDKFDVDATAEVTRQLAQFAKDQNLLSEDLSGFRRDLVNGALLDQALSNLHFQGDQDASTVVNAILQLRNDVRDGNVDLRTLLGADKAAEEASKKADKGKGNTKIDIHRIEVASSDPDRFAYQLVSAVQKANNSPSQIAKNLRHAGSY